MMRNTICTLIIALAMSFITGGLPGAAVAGIIWDDDDFEEFRFAVEENGGFFQYAPTAYLRNSFDEEECAYRPTQSQTDSYDCVANGNLAEFTTPPGDIWLNGMAKGPDGGVSPPNGLIVQGYLETIPSGLGFEHAVDVNQSVISWVSRNFSVDQEGEYNLSASLRGLVQFDDYDDGAFDRAFYDVSGEIMLEEIIDGDVFALPGFPLALDDLNPTTAEDVPLRTQTNAGQPVSYQLKITLTLQSEIVNYNLATNTVSRIIDGTFELGSESSPYTLEAKIRPKGQSSVATWMNLLLFDD